MSARHMGVEEVANLSAQLRQLADRADDLEAADLVGELERLRVRAFVAALPTMSSFVVADHQDASILLEAKAIGQLLGVPEGAARDLMRRGELPVVLVGKKYKRVRRGDVLGYIAAHTDPGV